MGKDAKMTLKKLVLFFMLLPCAVNADIIIPDPVSSVQHDSIFRGSLTCTLSCVDDSATIYYTTDGINPTTISPFSPPGWSFNKSPKPLLHTQTEGL
jgi:hypothetical protein